MVYALSHHVITPLGEGAEANIEALLAGRTELRSWPSVHGQPLVEPVVASLLDFEKKDVQMAESPLVQLLIRCARVAIEKAQIDAASPRCVFVLSSTKGDIWEPMAETAARVARHFGNEQPPLVVSTACTSGVSAQLMAQRLLEAGRYDEAVVMGADLQCEFIVSGFQSFKALSASPCRPFDASRDGLNAGEAIAAIVMSCLRKGEWAFVAGSVHNDANHISGPSRTAEGSWRCLRDVHEAVPEGLLATLSVHGTGTLYNDEMEALAIHRADLEAVPVSALKGFYGHTMGAAGLLETILTMEALQRGVVLPSRGFSEQGTTHPVNLSAEVRPAHGTAFIKLLSGFGGVNAAVAWQRTSAASDGASRAVSETVSDGASRVASDGASRAASETVSDGVSRVVSNGASRAASVVAEVRLDASADLVQLYRQMLGNYPKFFKMDTLSRLGFLAVEMLRRQAEVSFDAEQTALLFCSRSASLKTDTDYQATIADKEQYYPSPATFVYTLPNIVAGEVAIYHHLYGETMVCCLRSEEEMADIEQVVASTARCKLLMSCWIECTSASSFQAHARLIQL